MKLLGASLTLCTLLTLSRTFPFNSTSVSRHTGLCEFLSQQSPGATTLFVPQCDVHGNFLPQQCPGSTGYCWCVDIITGEEIPHTRTPPGTVPVRCDGDFYCPYGWSRFGKRCFIFINSPRSWVEAEAYCLFEGANLASIHSYEESHFIQSLTRGYTYDFPEAWIGGHDAVHLGFWMWSDGSKFNFDNWYKEYEMARSKHCLKTNYGF
ncbi:galactose-specific lectin nattectin-like [Chelmon rostratus]|uniref:galactose-specific lectin nattectin-like n=1 Tax=Chelmon rostratus TaxID=109905 RepID=UPI001BE6FA6F|nr:galactose-specific lectin nattectin-like [Chelmon rostratus]